MRIASNKLKDMAAFYHRELNELYPPGEVEAMLDLAVEHYLGFSKTERLTKADENLNQSDLLKLYDCAKALKEQKPLQYILKEAWFYGLRLGVDPHVLIPRPETEELVNLIVNENRNTRSFLDIGTGSGCIPIALKKNCPEAEVTAVDISKEALEVATLNAEKNAATVRFLKADILNLDMTRESLLQRFDVIVSNPPYIREDESSAMSPNVIRHEPHLALFVSGNDDIIFYKRIVELCKTHLNANGKLYFELNPLTAEHVKAYALASSVFTSVELVKDMSGKQRFLKAERKAG